MRIIKKVFLYFILLEDIIKGILRDCQENDFKKLFETLNKYSLWKEFQYIGVLCINELCERILRGNNGYIDSLIDILKYPIISSVVIYSSKIIDCYERIINSLYIIIIIEMVIKKMNF